MRAGSFAVDLRLPFPPFFFFFGGDPLRGVAPSSSSSSSPRSPCGFFGNGLNANPTRTYGIPATPSLPPLSFFGLPDVSASGSNGSIVGRAETPKK